MVAKKKPSSKQPVGSSSKKNQVTSNIASNRKYRSRNDPQTGVDLKRKTAGSTQLPTRPTVFAKSGGGDMLPYYSASDIAGIKKAKAKKK